MSGKKRKITKLPLLNKKGDLECDNCKFVIKDVKLEKWLEKMCPKCHKEVMFSVEDWFAMVFINNLVAKGGIKINFYIETKAVKETIKLMADIAEKLNK